MGGRMWAESEGPGKGSTFLVHDRGAGRRAAGEPAPRLRRRPARAAGQARPDRRRQRDQPAHPRAADRASGAWRRATPSRRARRCAGSTAGERFDLAILDMHMPEMDGLALARRIRAAAPKLPLVLFSSLGRREAGDAESLFDGLPGQADAPVAPVRHAGQPARARARGRSRRPRAAAAAARPEHGGAPPAAHPARRGQRREPEAGACACCSRWATAPTSPSNGIEAVESVRAPGLRCGPDGRADARARRPRRDPADLRAAGRPSDGRASSP